MHKTNERDELVAKLMVELGLSQTIVNLLVDRGFTDSVSIDKFLHPSLSDLHSPFDIINMKPAVALIRSHIERGSNILIFGDYDCDGVGASAILFLAFEALGGKVRSFIPTRHDDGYGLSKGAIDKVVESFKPNLIITVDCGISSVKEVAYVKSLGIDILVTDHHEPQEELPDCLLVDPKLQDDGYPQLCGAGVALKVVEALTDLDNAMQYSDICAISTIADLVPLDSDNRIIAYYGLQRLNKTNRLAPRQGLNILKELCKIKPNQATAYDIGFKIAPRINASGRLSSAQKSFDLLTSTDAFLVKR
ncbi:MAG: DHH family phosphoesterase, partial [Bacillota bacterium]